LLSKLSITGENCSLANPDSSIGGGMLYYGIELFECFGEGY
jgi:hypothetical protein